MTAYRNDRSRVLPAGGGARQRRLATPTIRERRDPDRSAAPRAGPHARSQTSVWSRRWAWARGARATTAGAGLPPECRATASCQVDDVPDGGARCRRVLARPDERDSRDFSRATPGGRHDADGRRRSSPKPSHVRGDPRSSTRPRAASRVRPRAQELIADGANVLVVGAAGQSAGVGPRGCRGAPGSRSSTTAVSPWRHGALPRVLRRPRQPGGCQAQRWSTA